MNSIKLLPNGNGDFTDADGYVYATDVNPDTVNLWWTKQGFDGPVLEREIQIDHENVERLIKLLEHARDYLARNE